ncbi:DeoR/GlpR family DNA-binding transcription regulator [Caproiciproducens sp. CPB-2]|uniref:DeoR/GlpR family DNA-binding transcription regulator n=1 Tax=Caproiciproducens sp. CPB-2 TaxID=3030017 RepID=UPI0023D9FFF8|nr:DeoR/GlpR family DNA-binding transcription regulator [Caproiciproducens sp. CPB-2]MDF1494821.1 DeoR/GlpR family DNA-binding transcription regulator [Caproiciproducens sp. CPB-2]
MKGRENEILELLTEQKRVEVTVLAEKLGVSQVTVRKDLDALESKGIIRREHGYAVLRSSDDINGRIAYHYETKRLIAAKANELIHDGETIMIESGSCCALLSEELVGSKRDVTIITNSAFIAGYVRFRAEAKVILLGGVYQNESQVMVGPMVKQCAGNFCVDKLFIGTDGYTAQIGFTNSDHLRAQAVRDMAPQAEQVIVLTESGKFIRHGVVPLQLTDRIKTVITDTNIPNEIQRNLEKQGVTVLTVPHNN